MFGTALGSPLDSVAHIIQVALAPAFLLSALATLLNVFSTRLGRVADKVDAVSANLEGATQADAEHLSQRLSYLRRRSMVLDTAVVLASLGGVATGVAVLTLFVGALRDATVASVLFGCFGLALLCTVGAIGAFLIEILMAAAASAGTWRMSRTGRGRAGSDEPSCMNGSRVSGRLGARTFLG